MASTEAAPTQQQASKPQLKPLAEQVIVILGASTGIGRVTAILAAQQGASVVLAARSDRLLEELSEEIRRAGGTTLVVPCDVTQRSQVDTVVSRTLATFGRIDSWVHTAGVVIFGRLDEVTVADAKRLFDINFFGVVNGCQAVLPALRANSNGGALIVIGSEESDDYPPLQGMYSASKHAVKGFLDCLRVETQEIDKAPIAITLIQPQGVDTPVAQHGRNYQDKAGKIPTPLVSPEQVAEAILHAAVHPTRSQPVGAIGHLGSWISRLLPAVNQKVAALQHDRQQKDRAPAHPEGILWKASQDIPLIEKCASEEVHAQVDDKNSN